MKRSERDLLYRSLDSSLTPGEQGRLDSALRKSRSLRDEHAQLIRLRGLVEEQAKPAFRTGFSQGVMDRLASESPVETASKPTPGGMPDFQEALPLMFRRVAVAASIAAILLLTYNMTTAGNISLTASFGLTGELYPEDLYDARLALETEGAL